MKAALQDGWMLTSLDGSADSKVSETLTALASIASSIAGATSGGAAKGAAKDIKGLDQGAAKPKLQLQPGLYGFRYESGILTGLYALTYFCDHGPVPADKKTWETACAKTQDPG